MNVNGCWCVFCREYWRFSSVESRCCLASKAPCHHCLYLHSKTRWNEYVSSDSSASYYYCTVKNSSITTKHLYLILTFRSHHEIFIRRSWYSVLPSLDATISCRIKKAVTGVTQLITALVSIHSSMTFLADVYSVFWWRSRDEIETSK